MLTGEHHPCQALADLLTLRERFGDLDGLKLAYVGDGNNVASSLMLLGAKAGLEVAVATPAELPPDPVVAEAAGAGGHRLGLGVADPGPGRGRAGRVARCTWTCG